MSVRLMGVVRKSMGMLAIVGACVLATGCEQPTGAGKPAATKPAETKPAETKPAEKPAEKPKTGGDEAGSVGGAGGGTATP